MKLANLVGERTKERPRDCVVDSHALMIKGGYMKYVGNGIYSSYLPLKKIMQKIEAIIRKEMNQMEGQEVSFPVVMPASLWKESGRYESIGSEMIRFTDRNHSLHVLGMTHEEAAVSLVLDYANSYQKYPFMIYQIQTKFRDEKRPRAGLIRVREFTMKNAYSFHTSQADLKTYYEKMLRAYDRFYKKVGLPQVISVASDSGVMGGAVSHEFMLLTPVGEDTIAICTHCGYKANMEVARVQNERIKENKVCPCGKNKTIQLHRGIEVGNIFQLGDKYTKAMHMTYKNEKGELCNPLMGCYGIGIGRLAASICEANHDENGPIWPIQIAPWQVHICAIRSDNAAVKQEADKLYEQLQCAGIEVLYDDRKLRAGVMFFEADLLGIPFVAILSPKLMIDNNCEIVSRDKTIRMIVSLKEVKQCLVKLIEETLQKM